MLVVTRALRLYPEKGTQRRETVTKAFGQMGASSYNINIVEYNIVV